MTELDLTLRLLVAAGLGAAVGLEREMRGKPAGVRTNTLIAMASALFTIVSIHFGQAGGTPDRVAAQIISGMGFLGGGAILRSGVSVQGLTTAATIWVNAAIGMAAGAGLFALAAIAGAMTLVVLAVLPAIESAFERRTATRKP
jgi:putative Mg2+ transporter-C (MgtC) family protein